MRKHHADKILRNIFDELSRNQFIGDQRQRWKTLIQTIFGDNHQFVSEFDSITQEIQAHQTEVYQLTAECKNKYQTYFRKLQSNITDLDEEFYKNKFQSQKKPTGFIYWILGPALASAFAAGILFYSIGFNQAKEDLIVLRTENKEIKQTTEIKNTTIDSLEKMNEIVSSQLKTQEKTIALYNSFPPEFEHLSIGRNWKNRKEVVINGVFKEPMNANFEVWAIAETLDGKEIRKGFKEIIAKGTSSFDYTLNIYEYLIGIDSFRVQVFINNKKYTKIFER